MIYFKKIRWKNFLSTGNAFTEIYLDRSPSTLIVGENGSGKSTLLDALTYSLFNKPFRNVTKPQLINSINNKNLLVEVEFSIGKKEYMIRRGAKPALFEIICDGEVLNQDASVRDYQKYLEESILKLNYKSFTQIVILGSASFTPFMQLPLASRREIIEDLLDIQIFTSMNQVLKQKMSDLRDKVRDLEAGLEVAKQKALLQKQYIETLESDKQKKIEKIKEDIAELEEKIQEHSAQSAALTKNLEAMGDVSTELKSLEDKRKEVYKNLQSQKKELTFYHDHDDCPTCKQGIPHEFKEVMEKEKSAEIDSLESSLEDIITLYEKTKAKMDEVLELESQISDANNEVINNQKIVQTYYSNLKEAQEQVGDIAEEKSKLKEMAKEVVAQGKEKNEMSEEKHYYDAASSLLKDSGIKTKIISQYLPVINKLVNKYLAAMDFFVQFELDDTFKETIKSRFRDKFSYANFSEGEKQRIDLALIFTWRTIAKMKNSSSTNLLLLDEVMDGSLDGMGMEYVMTLLNAASAENTNVFVISHRGDQFYDKFRSVIKFEKKQNYSVMSK